MEKKEKIITLRLSEEQHKKLVAIANGKQIGVSALIRMALAEYIIKETGNE